MKSPIVQDVKNQHVKLYMATISTYIYIDIYIYMLNCIHIFILN